MNKLKSNFCEVCSYELRYGFCHRCCDSDMFAEIPEPPVFTERKEAAYCGKTIRKIQEYIFNTANFNKELPDHNISERYLKQTVEFLNNLLNE